MDRMTMLKKLTFIGPKNINIFDEYIPDHYDEIYSLYSLLADVNIDYENVSFAKPKVNNDYFVICCGMSSIDLKCLRAFIKNNPIIKYMRNKAFGILIKTSKQHIDIRFTKN